MGKSYLGWLGATQGLRNATKSVADGMLKADEIKYQRELRRQQAQQFELSQTKEQMQIEMLGHQIRELEMKDFGGKIQRGLFNYFSFKGNPDALNQAMQTNPELSAKVFPNIVAFKDLNSFSPEEQEKLRANAGLTQEEFLHSFRGEYAVAIDPKGEMSLVNMFALSAGTNSLEALNQISDIRSKIGQRAAQWQEFNRLMDLGDFKGAAEVFNNTPQSAWTQAQQLQNNFRERFKNSYSIKDAESYINSLRTNDDKSNTALYEVSNNPNLPADTKDYLLNFADNSTLAKTIKGIMTDWDKDLGGMLKAFSKIAEQTDDDKLVPMNIISEFVTKTQNALPSFTPFTPKSLNDDETRVAYQHLFNTVLRITSGKQVTANELDRVKAELGSLETNEYYNLVAVRSLLGRIIANMDTARNKAPVYFDARYGHNYYQAKNLLSILDTNIDTLQTKKPKGKNDFTGVGDNIVNQVKKETKTPVLNETDLEALKKTATGEDTQ